MKEYRLMLNEEKIPYLEETTGCINEEIIIDGPSKIYEIAKRLNMPNMAEEQMVLITYTASGKGTHNSSPINQKGIYTRLLLMGATQFVVMHNHPSGEVNVSKNDKLVCELLEEIAKKLDLNFADFLIIGNEQFLSFFEQGLLIK